jgi:hypothetical protein
VQPAREQQDVAVGHVPTMLASEPHRLEHVTVDREAVAGAALRAIAILTP